MKILENPVFGEDYQRGQVFFSFAPNGFYSKGIALFTQQENESGIPVSHCGLILDNDTAIESIHPQGVRVVNFREKYVNNPEEVVMIKRPAVWNDDTTAEIVNTMQGHMGDGYATWGIVGAAILLSLTKLHSSFEGLKNYKNPLNRAKYWTCSELLSDGVKSAIGPVGILKHHPSNIFPQELFEDKEIWAPWRYDISDQKIAEGKSVVDCD